MKKHRLLLVLLFGLTLSGCGIQHTSSSSSFSVVESSISSTSGSSSSSSSFLSSVSSTSQISTASSGSSSTPISSSYSSDSSLAAGCYIISGSSIQICQNTFYTDKELVAAYINIFNALPINYVGRDQTSTCGTYGSSCRINGGIFQNREGYLPADRTYTECDIGGSSYSVSNRGAYRIVFSITNGKQSVFYTNDHYDNYQEYLKYYIGWGSLFGSDYGTYSD